MARFRNTKFNATTINQEKVTFYIKDIMSLDRNFVDLSLSNKQWLVDGDLFVKKEYEITPESLAELLNVLESYKDKLQYSFNSSLAFLKLYPTMEDYKKALDKDAKLPTDERELL